MKHEDSGTETAPAKDVAGQFSFSVKLDQSNDKTINITGFIYAGDTLDECNARVDMIDEIVSRQVTRSSIPLMEADLEQRMKGMDGFIQHLQGITEQREVLKNKPRATWSATEKKEFGDSQKVIDLSATNLEAMRKDIDKRRAAIAEAKEKVS